MARVIERSSFKEKLVSIRALSVQPRAISRSDIADAGLKEKDYWASHWIVKKANSVEYTKEDPRPDLRRTNGIAIPMEVNSPKLAWRDPHTPLLVSKVLSRMKTMPTYVNHTCDVHVHVGRCDGVAFTLTTLKKLATIFWLAEPVLRSVRNPHSPNFNNDYTWGFDQRRYSRLALALEKRSSPADDVLIGEEMLLRVRSSSGAGHEECEDWAKYMDGTGSDAHKNEALRAIWLTTSARELGLLLSGPQRKYRRLGFNFSAFGGEDERSRTNPRTVEFRILEGTLQEDLVQGWLQICGKLVELGMKGRQTKFRDVVRYLVAEQPAYDELRQNAEAADCHMPERQRRTKWQTRDALFAGLMEAIDVRASSYNTFLNKIRWEYGLS
ncbi:MAG: hypothetical protein STHCBS139747_007459 [Sporothrix thermara]